MDAENSTNIFANASLMVADAVDRGIDRSPARIRSLLSSAVDCCVVGAALMVPFLYALGNREGSFLDASDLSARE